MNTGVYTLESALKRFIAVKVQNSTEFSAYLAVCYKLNLYIDTFLIKCILRATLVSSAHSPIHSAKYKTEYVVSLNNLTLKRKTTWSQYF